MTDAALWNTWRTERDPEAFAQIAARYAGLVFGTCQRVLQNGADAEDASQECFLELLRVDLPPPQSLAPFLHTLAVRRALDFAKRERRREAREARFVREKPAAYEVSPDELTDCVDAAIAELPDELRVPLVARFLEGLTYEALAGRLGVPESTARHRVKKATEALRAILVRRGVTVPAAALAASLGGLAVEAAPPALLAQLGKLALAGIAAGAPAAQALSHNTVLLGALAMKKVQVAALLSVLAAILGVAFVYRGASPWRWSREAPPAVPVARDALPPRAGDRGGGEPPDASVLLAAPPPGATIKGQVRDAGSGGPLAGALLRAGELEATSDATGGYSFPTHPAGTVELAASLRGFVALRRLVEVEDGGEAAVDLVLEPALEVLAEDAGGAALEGAEVYLHELSDGGPAGEGYGPFTTGGDGKAFVDDVPRKRRGTASRSQTTVFARRGGDAVLTGIATQHFNAPADGSAPNYPASPFRVVLVDSVLVAGRVEVPPGRDPRDVIVSVLHVKVRDPRSFLGPTLSRGGGEGSRPWPQLFEVHPGADARFELAWVPRASVVTVHATGPGLGPAMFQSEDPRALGAVVLALAPEGAIEGTLAFEGTGTPAVGWPLIAMSQGFTAGRGPFTVEVATDGRFRFEGLPADAYKLNLPQDADRSEWTLGVQGLVRVRSGETVRGVELLLEKGAMARGRITDASSGEPVSGVWVNAVQDSQEPSFPVGGAVTDDHGRYEIRLPRGRSKLYLSSIPQGFHRIPGRVEQVVEVAAGEVERGGIDFELSPGEEPLPPFLERFEALGQAAGRVVDATGAPLPYVAIEAHRQWQLEEGSKKGPWLNPTHRAFTGEDGRYEVPVAAGKPYKVLATGAEYSAAWSEVFQVEKEREHAVEDLRLRRGTSSLGGVIVDADGRGIEGAELYATSKTKGAGSGHERLATDAQGRFRVEHLLEGELVRLIVARAGYGTREWTIAPGSSDLRLVLHPSDDGNRTGEKRLPDPRDLIGRRAPPWSVERWVREPLAPSLRDRPERSDGKTTVIVLSLAPSDWEESQKQLEAMEALCARYDAAAVVIFSSTVHESAVVAHLPRLGPRVAVGIDRFVPRSEYQLSDATLIAYGYRGSPTIIVVEPGGTVTHVVHDLEALEEALRR